MPDTTTRATVDAYLAHLDVGDIDGALELLAEPVDWDLPGSEIVPWVGRRSTRAEIATFFALLDRHLVLEEFVVSQVLVDGPDAVVIGHLRDTVKATGETLRTWFSIHFTVLDGKITRYHFYEDSHAVAVALEPAVGGVTR